MSITRTCGICGAVFNTGNGKAKYCSDGCRTAAMKQRQAKWRKDHPDYHKEYLRNGDARKRFEVKHPNYDRDRFRKLRGSEEYTRRCVVCGGMFTTYRPNKLTCSAECKAENRKRRERARGADPDESGNIQR